MEATKKCQKIKKSMGRRNAICLPGCSCSFCSARSPRRGVWGRHRSRVVSLPGRRATYSTRRRFTKQACSVSPPPPRINNKINKSLSFQTIQTQVLGTVSAQPFSDVLGLSPAGGVWDLRVGIYIFWSGRNT